MKQVTCAGGWGISQASKAVPWAWSLALVMVLIWPSAVRAQADVAVSDVDSTKARIRELEAELARLKARLRVQAGRAGYIPLVALPAANADVQAVEEDGQAYDVGELLVQYARSHPGHPALEDVLALEVGLIRTESGFVAPRHDQPAVNVRIMDLQGQDGVRLYGSAIRKISITIVDYFNRMGIIGVFVGPDYTQINARGEDIRPEGDKSLRLIIRTAVVSEIRTLASGERIPVAERINNPAHTHLIDKLPIKPSDGYREDDLLNKEELNRYVARLNRHPGRRVDVAIAGASDAEPGSVALDLLVAENKPWTAYFQISNTGTESTSLWRERFGFYHNQLTGNDDIFSLDYVTGGFDNTHAIISSYEAPVLDSDVLRWKVYGMWSTFTADDVGAAGEQYEGSQWSIGGELQYNVAQFERVFIDLFGGVEWNNIRVDNQTLLTEGDIDLFWLKAGARAERTDDISDTRAEVGFKFNMPQVASGDDNDANFGRGQGIPFLGRGGNLEDNMIIFNWDVSHSIYLDPFLFGTAWKQTDSVLATLAHELFIRYRGQTTFDQRVIPQETMTVGGFYTVRGYDESEASGDVVNLVNVEYRLHIPKLFPAQPDPSQTPLFGQPFRWSRQYAYGSADWDLIFRGFFDYAHTYIEKKNAVETDRDLTSAGIGLEFLFKRNLSVRADYGWALTNGDETEAGDSKFHFVATVLY